MRSPLPCAAIVLAIFLTACGETRSDREQVVSVVDGYLDALAERDGPRACRLLTREAQIRAWRTNRVHAAKDHPEAACAKTVKIGFFPIWGTKRLRRVAITAVRTDGDRARARVDGFLAKLVRIDGEWKLDVSGLGNRVGDSPPRRRG